MLYYYYYYYYYYYDDDDDDDDDVIIVIWKLIKHFVLKGQVKFGQSKYIMII